MLTLIPVDASSMLKPTKPSSMTPNAAERMCPRLAVTNTDVRPCIMSSMTMINRLKTQLPRTSPTAMFGASATVTELTPVASSGRDVTLASRTRPTHVPPSPVFSAMASP